MNRIIDSENCFNFNGYLCSNKNVTRTSVKYSFNLKSVIPKDQSQPVGRQGHCATEKKGQYLVDEWRLYPDVHLTSEN